MLRVRILAGMAGENRSPGEILDLPVNEAQALLEQGRAELVRSEGVETPERRRPVERATKRTPARERR